MSVCMGLCMLERVCVREREREKERKRKKERRNVNNVEHNLSFLMTLSSRHTIQINITELTIHY